MNPMSHIDNKTHWENAWRTKKAKETSWYQAVPTISLSMIRNSGLEHDAAVIDVGGGASLLVDHLLSDGYRDLTVLDISAAAIAQARARLGEHADRVKWVTSDITCFKPTRAFGLWHDRAAFHFLTDPADRERYVDVLYRSLAPGGQAIIASFAPGGPRRCSGLDIVQYDAQGLQAVLGEGMVLLEQEEEHHLTPAGAEQKFGFYRFGRVA
jgi:SAM-dependent methyltransferase